MAVDTVDFADATALVQRFAKETGIPPSKNTIMAATHNHNSLMVSLHNAGGSRHETIGSAMPAGKLPFDLPSDMVAVMSQAADVPFDMDDPLFKFGFGLTYNRR